MASRQVVSRSEKGAQNALGEYKTKLHLGLSLRCLKKNQAVERGSYKRELDYREAFQLLYFEWSPP